MIIQVTPEQKAKLKSTFKIVENTTIELNTYHGVTSTYFENCQFNGRSQGLPFLFCAFDACTFNCEFYKSQMSHTALINSVNIVNLRMALCFMVKSNFPNENREDCVPFVVDLLSYDDFTHMPSGELFPQFRDSEVV